MLRSKRARYSVIGRVEFLDSPGGRGRPEAKESAEVEVAEELAA